MARRKRATGAPPPTAERAEPTPAPAPGASQQTEAVCVTMDVHQRERLTALCARNPRDWGRSQWVRHAMHIHEQLEEIAASMQGLEAYAIQQHLTLPAHRRPGNDWAWILDALCQLARERLTQLESRGKLPSGQ